MSKLAGLAPTEKTRVIDLVRAAGVDVSDWANFKKGKNKKKAGVNPKYCYEWAFVQTNEVVVLNIWFDALKERAGKIWCELNERESALRAAQLGSSDPPRPAALRLRHSLARRGDDPKTPPQQS
jgi:5-methylcytosine-specific restriction protein A